MKINFVFRDNLIDTIKNLNKVREEPLMTKVKKRNLIDSFNDVFFIDIY